mgnify:CR=1 FL=1
MKLIVYPDFCEELEGLWRSLESSQQYIFQAYNWMKFWQRTIGQQSMAIKPWIAVILNSEGQPRMIFPFCVRRRLGARVVEFLASAQGDYQGPLIHDSWVSDFEKIQSSWEMVCKALPGHDVRHFSKLPAHWGASGNVMLKIWKSAFQDNAYFASLPASFKEFQDGQRTKIRADSKRQRRRLSEIGVVKFEMLNYGDIEWDSALDKMAEQKSHRLRRMGVPDMFSCEQTRLFYRDLPNYLSTGGEIHFSVLKVDDEIVASHWGGILRDRFYYLMPTITDGNLRVYSPGRLLLENLVEWCVQNEIKVFDFTIGGEEYKRDWCDREMPIFEHLRLITPIGALYFCYIRLRRYARKNDRMWSVVKLLYSWFVCGKKNQNGKNS